MSDPVLVIMAAGMGSRYGGLKQIDPVGLCGEKIIDFSIGSPDIAPARISWSAVEGGRGSRQLPLCDP